jgi:hypothetical protein
MLAKARAIQERIFDDGKRLTAKGTKDAKAPGQCCSTPVAGNTQVSTPPFEHYNI